MFGYYLDLSIDIAVQYQQRGQQEIGYYDGYNKKAKGCKVHALVTPQSLLPVTIDLGPGDYHESRSRLFPLLKNVRIRGGTTTRRPRNNRPKRVYGDKKYNTPLVMMYLASRGIIAARIKERANWKRKRVRPSLFDYETYTKVRSSVERLFSWLEFSPDSDQA